MSEDRSLIVGIVAAEPSGDLLGADLIKALRQQHPKIEVVGVGGPAMIQLGLKSLFPIEKLSVMGFVEVLGKLREILKIRKATTNFFLQNPPDIFIGIDAPDFNLSIEKKLKAQGIKTVHYTSPTVWAWKAWRLKKIKLSTNLMLTLFPFENVYYEQSQIPVKFVGHPLADMIALESEVVSARQALKLPEEKRIIALLPGSRSSEIKFLGPVFLETAKKCLIKDPDLHFIVPMINQKRAEQFMQQIEDLKLDLPISIFLGQSHTVLQACDAALVASGTATLETALFKKPMVVAYRCARITYWIGKCLVRVRSIVLPNLLAEKNWIPEFIQDAATPESLSLALMEMIDNPELKEQLEAEFTKIHLALKRNAGQEAAKAVLELIH